MTKTSSLSGGGFDPDPVELGENSQLWAQGTALGHSVPRTEPEPLSTKTGPTAIPNSNDEETLNKGNSKSRGHSWPRSRQSFRQQESRLLGPTASSLPDSPYPGQISAQVPRRALPSAYYTMSQHTCRKVRGYQSGMPQFSHHLVPSCTPTSLSTRHEQGHGPQCSSSPWSA